jgi:hypothetical protein
MAGVGFELSREEVGGAVYLRLSGTFDVDAARQLESTLGELAAVSEVVVDFSKVRDFLDLSVSVVAPSLARRAVQLRGLRGHQVRMFEYFGIASVAKGVETAPG